MSFLLDTPVFSEYTKKQPAAKVIEWIELQDEDRLYLSVLTVGELAKGIEQLAAGKRKNELTDWFEELVRRFDTRVLPLDTATIRRWAIMTATAQKAGRVLPLVDSLIAATGLAHDLTVVTRNTADFAGTDVTLLDIWD